MSQMEVVCPACGSKAPSEELKKTNIPIDFGLEICVEEVIYSCQACDCSGDFADINDQRIAEALEGAKKRLTVVLLDKLIENGISMSYFERALDLPFGSLDRWRRGDISAVEYALLKIIFVHPALLDIADNRFANHQISH